MRLFYIDLVVSLVLLTNMIKRMNFWGQIKSPKGNCTLKGLPAYLRGYLHT